MCFLALFLLSGMEAEWSQADGVLSCVKNAVSFSKAEDVLTLLEPKEEPTGDVCILEKPALRVGNTSVSKKQEEKNRVRMPVLGQSMAGMPCFGTSFSGSVDSPFYEGTYSSRIILSYMQEQDGKKDLFI